jgi:hypothetical protein
MNSKKLAQHGRKLFAIEPGIKIARKIGLKQSFVSQIKNGRAYLPAKYIPVLVELYGNKGVSEDYLMKLTKDGGL